MSHMLHALTPALGSRWVWEVDEPAARCIIEVTGVKWNGEEWFVKARSLLPNPAFTTPATPDEVWNSLDRFREACQQVGNPRRLWIARTGIPGTQRVWQRG